MPVPHVTHLVLSLSHGGLERLVVDWTNARNQQYPGSTVVCCLDSAGELVELIRDSAVHVLGARRQRFPWDAEAVRKIRELALCGDGRPILHSHNMAAQQYAALAVLGRRKRLGHVSTQHGANIHNRSLKNRLRARMLAMLTDRIVAVSQSTAAAMRQELGIPGSRIRVIPNGIAPHVPCDAAVREQLRGTMDIPANAFVIGSVGRLDAVKGHDRLLRALPGVFHAHPQVRLLLVGAGPAQGALAEQAATLGVADRVIFAGYQSDARRWLDAMDLFVLPSRSEGLSVALLEAMSAGVPVMVTDVGENRAVIADGSAGVMLPDDESTWPAMIADAVMIGPGADGERATLAARRVGETYSLERTLLEYEKIYGEEQHLR